MKLHSLARPPLTSCSAARFLTGRGPVPVHGPGVGDLRFRVDPAGNPARGRLQALCLCPWLIVLGAVHHLHGGFTPTWLLKQQWGRESTAESDFYLAVGGKCVLRLRVNFGIRTLLTVLPL